MSGRLCERDREVQAAAASGRWPAELARHAGQCASCRETRLVTELLQAPPVPPPPSVDPRVLFACARHVRRLHTESRMSLVVSVAQLAALGLALAAILPFVHWPASWPAWSFQPDTMTWIYGTGALLTVAVFGLARWVREGT